MDLSGDSAERVGTGQRISEKTPPEQTGARLLDGIETAQARDDHHQQAADDDRGGNPRLGARVGETVEQRAQPDDLFGPGEQAS